MRVLMVSADDSVIQLSKAIAREGAEVSVLFPAGRDIDADGLPVIPVEHKNPFYFTWFAYRIAGEAKKFDIVHGHHITGTGFSAALSERLFRHGKPLVSAVYNDDIQRGRLGLLKRMKARLTLSVSHAVVFQTEFMLEKFGKPPVYGIIPQGIPDDYVPRVSKAEAKRSLGLEEKFVAICPSVDTGFSYMVRGFADAFVPDSKLAVPKYAEELDIDFRGVSPVFISKNDARLFMRAADVCVIPSTSGLSYAEAVSAMACGTVVVATEAGNLPHIIGDAGITVPICSAEAISESLRELYRDQKLMKRCSTLGFLRSKEFCWKRIAEKTVSFYRKAIAGQE